MARKIDPDKRLRILAAARDMFKAHGVEKTSISLVARSAGVATGTIYLYFRSKDEIIAGLVDLYMTQGAARFLRASAHPDLFVAVKDAVHEALQHASENRDLLRLVDVYRGGARSNPVAGDETAMASVEAFIRRAQADGVSVPYHPRIFAEMISGMLEWIAKLCFVYKVADIQRYEETLVRFLQQGLLQRDHAAPVRNHRRKAS